MVKTVIIPAAVGGVDGRLAVKVSSARVFACISASEPFSLRVENEQAQPVAAAVSFTTTRKFDDLLFINTTATAISVTFYTGNEPYTAPQITTIDGKVAATVLQADSFGLAAGAEQTFIGALAGQRRKAIVVTNLDLAIDLKIRATAGGDNGATVFFRSAWAAETSATVIIHNPGAVAVTVEVLEIFYS